MLLADGGTKPIEDVKEGDRVLGTDVESRQNQGRVVTDVRSREGSKTLVTITVDVDGEQGSKTGSITSTAEHLIWLPDAGTWVTGAQLKPGMWLQTAAGTWVQITAITKTVRQERVHNLTVDGVHTYYVVADETPILVHNCPDTPAPSKHDTAIGPVDANSAGPVTLPRVVFDSSRMPNIAANIRAAQASGKPMVLNRTRHQADIDANRAAACAGFCGAPLSPDEYPFASSMQGGAGARILGVPLPEQRRQGGVLSAFYRKFGIGHGDPFEVVVK